MEDASGQSRWRSIWEVVCVCVCKYFGFCRVWQHVCGLDPAAEAEAPQTGRAARAASSRQPHFRIHWNKLGVVSNSFKLLNKWQLCRVEPDATIGAKQQLRRHYNCGADYLPTRSPCSLSCSLSLRLRAVNRKANNTVRKYQNLKSESGSLNLWICGEKKHFFRVVSSLADVLTVWKFMQHLKQNTQVKTGNVWEDSPSQRCLN